MLTNEMHERYDEAVSYIKKARDLDGANIRISKVLREMKSTYVNWLNSISLAKYERMVGVYNSWMDAEWGFSGKAKEETEKGFVEAMTYLIRAAKIDPSDINTLNNIEIFCHQVKWIPWGNDVHYFLNLKKGKK